MLIRPRPLADTASMSEPDTIVSDHQCEAFRSAARSTDTLRAEPCLTAFCSAS